MGVVLVLPGVSLVDNLLLLVVLSEQVLGYLVVPALLILEDCLL